MSCLLVGGEPPRSPLALPPQPLVERGKVDHHALMGAAPISSVSSCAETLNSIRLP